MNQVAPKLHIEPSDTAKAPIIYGQSLSDTCINNGLTYQTTTFNDLVDMAEKAPSVPKNNASWFLGSTTNTSESREHKFQRENGLFALLSIDIDVDTAREAVIEVMGDSYALVYSTRSATPALRKWRVLIPLARLARYGELKATYKAIQKHFASHGIVLDDSANRSGQVQFVPNRGELYQHFITGDPLGRLPVLDEVIDPEPVKPKPLPPAKLDAGNSGSVIRAFNEAHDLVSVMASYGYQHGHGPHWRSPMQTSDSYATEVIDQRWRSLSESDRVCGIGAESDGGDCRTGDCFDLFAYFVHSNNRSSAVKDAARLLGLEAYSPASALSSNPFTGSASGTTEPAFQRQGDAPNPSRVPNPVFASAELLAMAQSSPPLIVEDLFYSDVGHIAAPGGVGKTTLLCHIGVCVATGRRCLGARVFIPGRFIYVTGEDDAEIIWYRVRECMKALNLTEAEVGMVYANFAVIEASRLPMKLTQETPQGILPAPAVGDLIAHIKDLNPRITVIDPLVSFSVGESKPNDSAQGMILACRQIRAAVGGCVYMVAHTSKMAAQNQSTDQYASRGGSAISDGSRMVHIASTMDANQWAKETGEVLAEGCTAIKLTIAKNSYGRKPEPFLIHRKGFEFRVVNSKRRPSAEEQASADALTVLAFMRGKAADGLVYSKQDITALHSQIGVPKHRTTAALAILQADGRIVGEKTPGQRGRGFVWRPSI